MSDFEMSFEPEKKKKGGVSYTWQEVWWMVLTKPSIETFDEILRDVNASKDRAYRWVFISTGLGAIASTILSVVFIGGYGGSSLGASIISSVLISGLCGALLGGLFGVLGLVISTGIEHLFVNFLGGRGQYGQLVYTVAAYSAPMVFVNLVVSMIFTQSPVSLNILSVGLGIYNIVLNVQALRSVYRVGVGPALGAIFLPGILFGCLCYFLILSILGPAISEAFMIRSY